MSLIQVDKFTPSKTPYAFAPKTFDGLRVDALWASRKRGRTVVTLGSYRLFVIHTDLNENRYRPGLDSADTRYGGEWKFSWNGEVLLVNPTYPLPPARVASVSEKLDATLRGFPDVPQDWDGWYYREKAAS